MITTIKAGSGLCTTCGKHEELRPYGANGTWICFDCAMKDQEAVEKRFEAILNGGLILDLQDQKGKP